jgi:exodeoxyribonuclease VII small subunit
MTGTELSFEEALEKLESCADKISSKETTLEEAIAAYEEGAAYSERCDAILNNARRRIRRIGQDAEHGAESDSSDWDAESGDA